MLELSVNYDGIKPLSIQLLGFSHDYGNPQLVGTCLDLLTRWVLAVSEGNPLKWIEFISRIH